MSLRGKETYCVHSVENALALLETLCSEDSEVSLSGLSDRLGMKKASVFRLMATFENHGYVEKRGDGGYRLGVSAFELGQKFLLRSELLRNARSEMEQLARNCDESVYLVLRRGDDVLFLDVAESTQKVKVVSLVGRRFPLGSLGVGTVFWAYGEGSGLGVPSVVENQAVVQTRRRGAYVGFHGESEDICCAACPLFDHSGSLVGVLAMVAPCYRMSPELMERKILPAMTGAAETISSRLGCISYSDLRGGQWAIKFSG